MRDIVNTSAESLKTGAIFLAKRLAEAGYQAFWVGGCVRDAQLDLVPTDYDIATDAKPDQIEQLFSKTIPVGKQFGVTHERVRKLQNATLAKLRHKIDELEKAPQ